MSRKEKFSEVLQKHGYSSINNFCVENKLLQTNVNKKVKDESCNVSLTTLFQWANILHEPVETLIEIFYVEALKENRDLMED